MFKRGDICLIIKGPNKGRIVELGEMAKEEEMINGKLVKVYDKAWWVECVRKELLACEIAILKWLDFEVETHYVSASIQPELVLRKLSPAPENKISDEEILPVQNFVKETEKA